LREELSGYDAYMAQVTSLWEPDNSKVRLHSQMRKRF
jgi:hypothetical protein